MEESNQLALKKTPLPMGAKGVQLESFEALWRFAQCVAASPFAPRGMEKPEAIVTAIQLGLEIGLSPMSALQNVAVINGRPGIYGDAALALVRASGRCEYYKQSEPIGEGDEKKVTVISKRDDSPESITSSFSVADAKKAGLWGKQGPWSQYPDRMLLFRARGFNLRDNFGDILKGLHTVEELSDLNIRPVEGRVVNGDGIKFGPAIPDKAPEVVSETFTSPNVMFEPKDEEPVREPIPEEIPEGQKWIKTDAFGKPVGSFTYHNGEWIEDKPKRHRRTKAQIEADEAAEDAARVAREVSVIGTKPGDAEAGKPEPPPRATPLEGLRNLIDATPITEFMLEGYLIKKGMIEPHQHIDQLNSQDMQTVIEDFHKIVNVIADGTSE